MTALSQRYNAPEVTDLGTVAEITGVVGPSNAQDVFVNLTSQTVFGFPPGETIGTGSEGGCWDHDHGNTCYPF
jgi:hypothetical protein